MTRKCCPCINTKEAKETGLDFSMVPSNRTSGNRHKLKHRKLPSNIPIKIQK